MIIGIAEKKAKELLENLPNKIVNTMGILPDVNLLSKDGKNYIEIDVKPCSMPIDYKGRYYYRSGSTKQLLKGNALIQFLMKKTGTTWDAAYVDDVEVSDLDKESLDIFRREARRCKRMPTEAINADDEELLDKLKLIKDGHLLRAAVVLFHRDPEKWHTGIYAKIGKFTDNAELEYQDEVHGSLMIIADRIIELIYLKYLKASITYDNVTRVETYQYPQEAVREAVFNALIHSDWTAHTPVQIKVMDNAMIIGNSCILPENWTIETLLGVHNSMPHNPNIASVFFKAGYIESWGRGIQRIHESCENSGNPLPEFSVHTRDILVRFGTPKTFTPAQKTKKTAEHSVKAKNTDKSIVKNNTFDRDSILTVVKDFVKDNRGTIIEVVKNDGSTLSFDDLILEILKEHPSATTNEIAKAVNVNARTIARRIRIMSSEGKIIREGGRKEGYWKLIFKKDLS